MLRPRGHMGLEAISFGLGLGLTLSGLGLDLGLMASGLGLIEIGLVASNSYSAHDINYYYEANRARMSNDLLEELVFLKCNDC